MHHARQLTFTMVLALTAVVGAQEKSGGKGTIYTDPQDAGPDYAPQGEFQGTQAVSGALVKGGKSGAKIGAQVIALGGGKFRAVFYNGGLPGDGWDKNRDNLNRVEGQREGKAVVFKHDGLKTTLSKGSLITVKSDSDKPVAQCKRVVRKSKTLGMNPPPGAAVLFDGKSAEGFVRGKLLPGGLLAANCESKEKFGDHSLHLEFRTPFKPYDRGQARGNSGMYVQSRYEVQILDSFGLEGENNECGGVYSIKAPDENMCYPPLTWQTYDADFTAARYKDGKKTANARLTLRHNGVVIHDDIELPKGTPGKAGEGPEPQGVYLQGHGNPVVFRNVWVVPK